ncbi:hypothetical protein GLOIN_2v1566418 [Rhizophagus irregularis DAOM 181602=DAOM 197198]|uniref:Uncharacterized protein n=1 Tax=Rhizophagus irregularis (strain DAOM 181602 / DAOM 197198 / MUCL 43194) TaxID=747089 RepID=A0A2P4QCP4_RHIID|nr:hypothetical protein GLOIN_2v1566418 [Rhizophagus irregularis DAOM 181602=DAOM 197198]POG75411.1 hypothetical protein GLOIN_2v1566418 [Rhizophagus irregularis DAOM 181602=DAOM 197198]|eukprot:XP_025182277.1 hypothetical protein GLOIN_2v1566418 [Rhizophagus irregularis DAOM 181602=DAOM 197198]
MFILFYFPYLNVQFEVLAQNVSFYYKGNFQFEILAQIVSLLYIRKLSLFYFFIRNIFQFVIVNLLA